MGKVRHLRKKYHQLCVKQKYLDNPSLPDDSKLKVDENDDGRSVISISKKSIKSVNGIKIQKKDKIRLRHHLFVKKVEALDTLKQKRKLNLKTDALKIILNDRLPAISNRGYQVLSKSPVDDSNHSFTVPKTKTRAKTVKKTTKIKSKQFLADVTLFKQSIKKKCQNNAMEIDNTH